MSEQSGAKLPQVSRRRLLQTASRTAIIGSLGAKAVTPAAADPGTQEWAFETDGAVSSPTVVDGTVFVGSVDNNLYAVDTETGTERWVFETGGSVISSPTVVDGTVFALSNDQNLYAVDAETGDQQWAFETVGLAYSSPTVVDGTVFVGTLERLYAVNAQMGTEQWTSGIGRTGGSLTVVDGTVFGGNTIGSELYAVDAETGTYQWIFRFDGTVGSPTVADGTVFVGSVDNNLYAVDAETGTEQWAFEADDQINSSPTVVDGTVFVGSRDNNLYAVNIETGTEQWAFETDDEIRSSPTVVDGTALVGSDDNNLYAVDAETGTEQWVFETGRSFTSSSPMVVDGTVFVGSGDNNLYAVDAGVDGSSEDSRVMLGTLGHHEDWRYSDQSINIPAYALYTTWVRNNSELLAIGGISIGGIVGGGYLFRRRSANKQSDQESADESSDGVAPTSETEQPSPATEKTDDDTSPVNKLRSEAETALETAVAARENSNLSGAADAYTEALSGYQAALEEVDAGDTETRAEIEDVLNTIRDDLKAVRTRQEQRDDILEALKTGERSFQEGIVAYTEGGHTLAKIRFRQARGAFEQAVDLVENTDNDDLLNPPIEVSVQSDSELASTTLGELPPIPEGAVTKLADAGVETIGDLESSDESPWPPAVVEPLVAEEIISDDAVAMLTLLSWWEDTDSYEFDTAAAISRRRDQAGHGFNQSS